MYSAFDAAFDNVRLGLWEDWSGYAQEVLSVSSWDARGSGQKVSVESRTQRAEGEEGKS